MKKVKVLLVDDEKEFVETLASRLQMRDVEANTVLNGEQALSALEEEEPDVIVLDLRMPGMDGIEVLKKVKESYPNVEIIMLTGHGSEKDEEIARSLGVFNYMKKPVDLKKLMSQIKGAFKQRMGKLESLSMAVTFAEAGEFETAKEMMEDEDEEEKKKKKKNKKGDD